MALVRCPRCLAEDISADAHPSRRLVDGRAKPFLVCRDCFRAAELEFRISCEAAGVAYAPLPIRDALGTLRDFYRERVAAAPDDVRVRSALDDVERRLAIGAVDS
ncbi:MAG: hypothetical protein E6H81_11785 [Chloroflexi bacterium]|nr:MAG: hypothetical protein E6H81_11785 [Chloroflexota bacterium]